MTTLVQPQTRIISRPWLSYNQMDSYLADVGGLAWSTYLDDVNDAQHLVEFAGRMCYRSWKPGLNPNVTRVRTDSTKYLENLLASGHGSVLEHINFTFVLQNVSRVFTHEWIRHRQGVAISQESLRYVRLGDIPMWIPSWAQEDTELMDKAIELLTAMETFQHWMSEHFNLDQAGLPFHDKKAKTSFMRRFAPEGLATVLTWTANARTLRHVIETRTAEGAEEEVRLIADQIGALMRNECPALFGDYMVNDKGEWTTDYRKV